MFEKLLSLLLHAKGGAVATVLVLGASGALVTATVENGTTTITITQPSSGADTAVVPVTVTTASNTTSNNTKVDPAILALFTRTKAEDDPTSPATGGNGCSDAAKANNEQVKAVNEAFKTDHQKVGQLRKDARTDAAKKAVSDADEAIKNIRQAAVKAIHATNPSAICHKDDDEDDEDVDEQHGDNHDDEDDNDGDHEDNDDNGTPPATGGATTLAVVFSGDAKAIADAAIAAMALWVKDAQAAIDAQPAATTNDSKKSDKSKSDNKSNKDNHDNKGKGGGDDDHEDDD